MTAAATTPSTVTAAATTSVVCKGPRRWLRAYRVMLRWELTSLRLFMPLTVAVQVLAGAGFAIGIGLLRDVPHQDAMFLATGTAVITLVLVGVILGPQIIAQQKVNDTYDSLWSLPVPRTAATAAWTTMTVLIGVPGMIAAVAVAGWRYHLEFELRWMLVPAVLLTACTATLIGYALAHTVGNSMITMSVTQVWRPGDTTSR